MTPLESAARVNSLPPSLALATAIFPRNIPAAIGLARWIDQHPFHLRRDKLPFRFRPWGKLYDD